MNNDILYLLRSIPLFSNLSPIYLTRLSEKAVSMKFDKGKTILEDGKNCNSIFITASGKMELCKKIDEDNELILNTITQGGIFGEAYVTDGSPVNATLRAVESSIVLCIDRPTIVSLLKENQEFTKGYIRHLCDLARESVIKEGVFLNILLNSHIEIPDPYKVKKPVRIVPAVEAAVDEADGVNAREDNGDTAEGEDEVFFKKEFICPLCKTRFSTLKPRQKYVIVEKTDEDFCAYYKTVNPLYYEINVCPQCGYSFNNSTSGPVKVEISDRLAKMISHIWEQTNYGGIRSLDDAIETFRLALECQKEKGSNDAAIGRLFLKLAWLYRYKNNKDMEIKNLEKALYHLTKSFDNTPEDAKEEMNLMFLLGQLNRILGSDREAVNWFIRITQHSEKKSYPYMVNRARDAWQEIRGTLK